MKKLVYLTLAVALAISALTGCRSDNINTPAANTPAVADTPAASTDVDTSADAGSATPANASGDFKIGIVTGTVSQNEEEFRAAQNMIAKYGADKIIATTYPDRFNDEVETTISQTLGLADQGAQAIVFVQGVPGTIAAIERTRETHPDVLFVVGVPQEAPREIASVADVIMLVDELSMGTQVIEQAAKQGAKTFIHYSFPRHLGIETIAARRALFIETCERLGIDFVDATAPDPTGDAGPAGAQQFIVEDVPRQVATYGKDTAFFSTNCVMQEPLIRSVMEQNAIYPQPCCPSPYHAFPAALNIDVTGREGDVHYMLEQISLKVEESGNSGRISNWPVPINMLMIEAGVDYAIKYLEGQTNARHDAVELNKSIDTIINSYGTEASVTLYSDSQGTVDNYHLILSGFVDF